MKKNPHKINYFLILYLILYLIIGLFGSFLFAENIAEGMTKFLPLVLGILYLLISRQPVLSSVKITGFHPLSIPLTILMTYCLWPLISIVNMISMLFAANHIDGALTQLIASDGFLYALFSMAILPACLEEFTFRGLIYGQYRNQRPIKAILFSSLCFGLMHMNFNQFSYAFVLGIFLSLLLEASGSLFMPILMHFTFNATSVCMVWVEQKLSNVLPQLAQESANSTLTVTETLGSIAAMLPIATIGCLLAYLTFRKIASLNGNWEEIKSWKERQAYKERPNYKLTGIAFYVFVTICLIMCVLMEVLS